MTELAQGDRITISATHKVLIDGEDSWIKLEINSAAQPGEGAEAALARVNGLVADYIVGVIENQANVILEANKAQR